MKLAIFDFDGTLLTVDTLPYLLKLWRTLKYSRARLCAIYFTIGGMYIRYKLRLYGTSREQMKKNALQKFTRIFKGLSKDQVHEFFDESVEPLMGLLNEDVVHEVNRVKEQGFHTVILSGCYQDLLERVGKCLDIDTVLGTKMYFSDNGVADVNKPMNIATGVDKVKRIQAEFKDREVDYTASCSYADSYSDIPILELVGHPIAVVPDPELKEYMAKKDWRVIK